MCLTFGVQYRGSYAEIRKARPDQQMVRKAMNDFIQNCKKENCIPQKEYIHSLGFSFQ